MSITNISDVERGLEFWDWIKDFPKVLSSAIKSKEFVEYLNWEHEWVNQQNIFYKKELLYIEKILDLCKDYGSQITELSVFLNPIKCAYSADYHVDKGHMIISSGAFRTDSIIHEYLHHIVHPYIDKVGKLIIKDDIYYPGIDDSYYLSGDENGKLNALEEYAVRKLTDLIMEEKPPASIETFIKSL